MPTNRRKFLQLLGAGAAAAAFPPSISRALAIPAARRRGTIADVEHIVILMQENRSFDHYFGTLNGVRGFADPRAVKLPSGDPVWAQPDGDKRVWPFHPSAPQLGLQFLVDLPHGWIDTHDAWNAGKYDRWVPSKSATTMAYLTRSDIPYHFALADAFTICDAYHCSFMGSTDPNRYYMWTGWTGNDAQGGGPVLDNSEAGYDWRTFPERLEEAVIRWKIYQDVGAGLDQAHSWGWGDDAYIGNYGDNSLLYFHQYQNAQPGSPLFDRARVGTNISAAGTLFDQLRADVLAGALPQVSWIAAPEAYTEHPNWPANYGAWYVSQVLDALTANPEVWSKTVFFLTYDENDGFFDHAVPATPPATRAQGLSSVDTVNEIFPGNAQYAAGPYGLGPRVPMLVISPWSKGGWVSSEVFDHTSLIRFIEQRFAGQFPNLIETNITPWRRAVVGDLTATLDFAAASGTVVSLPSTAGYVPSDSERHPDFTPDLPSEFMLPPQEPGVRPARPVPYELHADAVLDPSGLLAIEFRNSGRAAAVFHVRSNQPENGPWSYTVEAGASLQDNWSFASGDVTDYELSVYGPNGFLRRWKLNRAACPADLIVKPRYQPNSDELKLHFHNRGPSPIAIRVADAYGGETVSLTVAAGGRTIPHRSLARTFGWYDLTITVAGAPGFEHQLAGHLETGRNSHTDPALG